MKTEIGFLIGLAAALLCLLLWFSLASRQESRPYRFVRRVFWAAALLWFSGAAGGVGLRLIPFGITAALGLPGYMALTALFLL